MCWRSIATGRHAELARIGLGIGNELGNGLGGDGSSYDHDSRQARNAHDRHDIADKIEVEFVIERRIYCVRRASPKERVSVSWRAHDRFGTDVGASAWAILDDEWLAEPLRQPLTYQPNHGLAHPTGRIRHDYPYGLRRIGLRLRDPRHRWERGSSRCQMQECAAAKFHRRHRP